MTLKVIGGQSAGKALEKENPQRLYAKPIFQKGKSDDIVRSLWRHKASIRGT